MLILFTSGNQYEIKDSLGCSFLEALLDCGDEKVILEMFEDVFQVILKKKVELDGWKDCNYLMTGLAYFGCVSLMNELYNLQRQRREKEIKKKIEEFFERHLDKIKWPWLSPNLTLLQK